MNRKLLLLAALLVVAVGCGPKEVAEPPKVVTRKVHVAPGLEVRAVLLSELTSGGSNEGDDVPMMVAEDIRDASGAVVVVKGTPLLGKVTWSRAEGALGALTNQPARLNFKFDTVPAVDGTALKLSAVTGEAKDYELNRDNTGKTEPSAQLEKLAEDTTNEQALEAVRELFDKGDASKLDSPETRQKLSAIAQQMGLANTSKLIEKNEVDKMNDLVRQLRQGGTVAALASGGSATLVDAALELANVAGQVGSRLGRMLGGRNIKAYVGTPVKAYVIEAAEVTAKG